MNQDKDVNKSYSCSKCQEDGLVWDKAHNLWRCLYCGYEESEEKRTITFEEIQKKCEF